MADGYKLDSESLARLDETVRRVLGHPLRDYRNQFHTDAQILAATSESTIRRGFLRSDLDMHGSCVIEEWEFVAGVLTFTGRTYRAFDPSGELFGTDNIGCCEWITRADTPTAAQLDTLDFPMAAGAPTPTESTIAELLRITCPDFLGCPCVSAEDLYYYYYG